jgi:hypothetical protein
MTDEVTHGCHVLEVRSQKAKGYDVNAIRNRVLHHQTQELAAFAGLTFGQLQRFAHGENIPNTALSRLARRLRIKEVS